MSEETKNEELQEEVEATDVVTEEKQKNSLKKRLKTKNCKKHLNVLKIFENKYLRAHAEMQNNSTPC